MNKFITDSQDSTHLIEKSENYFCEACKKSFIDKTHYQNHVLIHSREINDPYSCDICAKTFTVPARLTRHYRTHTGEKPYECEYCRKSFSVKENLSVHRRIHTKERPYKCDICERAFEHSGKLHRHMRIHTGERPHKCSICNKTFIQSGQLVIHMRTHTGEKPYVCKSCNKGFTCSKQLKVHTRTHTGEKPYTCEICGKSFGYNHVLKLHQVAHYGEKVYKCTICHETFNSKKIMELHIKSHSETQSYFGSINEFENINNISSFNSYRNMHKIIPGEIDINVSFKNSLFSNKAKFDEINGSAQNKLKNGLSLGSRIESHIISPNQISNNTKEGDNELRQDISVFTSKNCDYQYKNVINEDKPNLISFNDCEIKMTNRECSKLNNSSSYINDIISINNIVDTVQTEKIHDLGNNILNTSLDSIETKSSMLPMKSKSPFMIKDLTLPPRKRCKMILESLETEKIELLRRQSSVIRFAKAS